MKLLLIAEYRSGALLNSYKELLEFAEKIQAETAMFVVGSKDDLPQYDGKLYFADAAICQEYNPSLHKQLLLEAIEKEQPEMIVMSHSAYGWDLAPRVAMSLMAAQVSEVIGVIDSKPVVPLCNGKLRRVVDIKTKRSVVTIQAGAFSSESCRKSEMVTPEIIEIEPAENGQYVFAGYEEVERGGVDLGKASVIVSGGRGIGKPDNMSLITELAHALGGEFGASRPVVDAEWAEHNRQVGTTGQSVAPKLYIACGISGAIQHLAGMKNSEFVVAVNTDREAPITAIADISVIADLRQFIPALTEKLAELR